MVGIGNGEKGGGGRYYYDLASSNPAVARTNGWMNECTLSCRAHGGWMHAGRN